MSFLRMVMIVIIGVKNVFSPMEGYICVIEES